MERIRRTMMFVPASNAGMLREANLYGADSIMFDLEDSISLREKDSARFLVYQAVKTIDYENTEIIVRINALDAGGRDDIEAMVRAGIDAVRLPKTETAQDVADAEEVIAEVEEKCGRKLGSTKIFAAIEGPLGVLNAYSIATASERIIGIAIGAEDYVTSMKTRRYPEKNSEELFFARSMIVHAARAAGIAAIDTVFSDVNDMDTLRKETEFIKQLGFDGKSVINPRQIPVINKVFTPQKKEIENAEDVMSAIKEAEANGSGVIALNGKMIDKPIVERAQRTLQLAKAAGMLQEGEQ
ncbi:aldolase/citrate lyase family protein [Marinilactibacillus psychrotolerans]|uniref:Aldolase/citrate lyase family protein n=2 Tax=Marinilactibacillus psychrotolerans TaxID=191770 RepID=A0ABW8UKC6_9LACT|nr:aldolase/citrate lyase family protein [Marinilactibacillus psychrotolerans]GEQ32965.1 citrate lyase subunit beta [Marinilactibacillus psychrotolerans]SJN36576.1 Citrate lyase beta chain [Marinilactibacillus psychrotolerans 42ea]